MSQVSNYRLILKNNKCHIVSLENPISIRARKPHSGSATTLLLLEQPNNLP